ncbi:MAG: fatty acid desaturase [Cyanobacteria bacterium J06635_15]
MVMPQFNNARSTATVGHQGQSCATGVWIALIILSIWLASLVWLLTTPLSTSTCLLIPVSVLGQTFLKTGLFITAHDAMHGVVYPSNLRINHGLGAIAAYAYALFPYKQLVRKHWLHHRYPECALDPDFHNGRDSRFIPWYLNFMGKYWSWQQFTGLAITVGGISYLGQICPLNLLLFWALPLVLSSLQLFYFGTFLPHRGVKGRHYQPYQNPNKKLTWLVSLLTCYHFGYHHEHHTYPQVPWWQLPQVAARFNLA